MYYKYMYYYNNNNNKNNNLYLFRRRMRGSRMNCIKNVFNNLN